jgi:predicted lipoprotein with Yx(FWY)xxD motif
MYTLIDTRSLISLMRAAMAITMAAAWALSVGCASRLISGSANVDLPYPKEVSLILEEQGFYSYVQSSTNAPLFYYDMDTPEKSNCNDGCDSQWAALWASDGAKPFGQWTLISRDDHRSQRVFDRHPMYVHIHDSAEAPNGDGPDSVLTRKS